MAREDAGVQRTGGGRWVFHVAINRVLIVHICYMGTLPSSWNPHMGQDNGGTNALCKSNSSACFYPSARSIWPPCGGAYEALDARQISSYGIRTWHGLVQGPVLTNNRGAKLSTMSITYARSWQHSITKCRSTIRNMLLGLA
jgi:hypothetical protein